MGLREGEMMTEPLPPAPTADGSDPFTPHRMTFQPVSTALIKARLIVAAISLTPPLIGAAVIAILVTPWLWLAVGVLALVVIWIGWLVPRQVRAMGYAERDEDFLIRKGILFRHLTVVPYGRMQYVDVEDGPIARHFHIATVQLHTASAATDATVPGLPRQEASRLRDRLTERGEARLEGL